MVPFWIPIIMQHLIFGVPKKGPEFFIMTHMSYSLNSLMEGYLGENIGDYYRGYQGDTRSSDYGSYIPPYPHNLIAKATNIRYLGSCRIP